jgi:hypothetical protein
MKPKRIQRKRTKGWKKPPNTVNITRPGKWGNPFKLMGDMIYCDASHRRTLLSKYVLANDRYYPIKDKALFDIIRFYKQWINRRLPAHFYDGHGIVIPPPSIEEIQRELRGKNLMCFCKESDPCHGDILLEIANR